MRNLLKQRGKSFGVYGLGVTGKSCIKALSGCAKTVISADDDKEKAIFHPLYKDVSQWSGLDYIVVSPGVPLYYPKRHKLVEISERENIPIISDLDLLYMEDEDLTYIGITGTNGKSTTTAMIANILAPYGFGCCGNIGMAALDVSKAKKGYVIETSSYQLDIMKKLQYNISVVLNISPDHMDRYSSYNEYKKSKLSILNRTKWTSVVDAKLGISGEGIIQISDSIFLSKGVSVVGSKLYDNYFSNNIYTISNIHTPIAVASSFTVAMLIGLPTDYIINNINAFKGLKHRLEYIGSYDNIRFYNDSKATNTNSTIYGLDRLQGNEIYLLAGGIFKEDIEEVNLELPVKKAYLFGKDANKITSFFNNNAIYSNIEIAFESALEDARRSKSENKVILLSPMCSSFDQFKNFEHRGEFFLKLFKQL